MRYEEDCVPYLMYSSYVCWYYKYYNQMLNVWYTLFVYRFIMSLRGDCIAYICSFWILLCLNLLSEYNKTLLVIINRKMLVLSLIVFRYLIRRRLCSLLYVLVRHTRSVVLYDEWENLKSRYDESLLIIIITHRWLMC